MSSHRIHCFVWAHLGNDEIGVVCAHCLAEGREQPQMRGMPWTAQPGDAARVRQSQLACRNDHLRGTTRCGVIASRAASVQRPIGALAS